MIFRRLLQLMFPLWKGLLASVLLGFLTIGSNIGLLTTSAYLISRAALHPPVLDLMVAIVGVRFFGISRAVFRYLERYVSHDITFRVLARVRVWFYQAIEPLAPARLMQFHSGDLLSSITADVDMLKNFYLRVLWPPLVALLVFLATTTFFAYFSSKIAFVFSCFFLIGGLGLPLLFRWLGRRERDSSIQLRSQLKAHLVDSIQGMAETVAYARVANQVSKVSRVCQDLTHLQRRQSNLAGLSLALSGVTMHLAMWVILVLAIGMVEIGRLPGIYLAMLALAVLSSFEALQPLPLTFSYSKEVLAAAKRLFSLTACCTEGENDPQVTHSPPKNYDLNLANLQFRYNHQGGWVLDDVDIHLPQGKRVALVGDSGAGKSTVVQLLLGFWSYQGGSITLGGRELREYPAEELRSYMAVVSQRTHLFNTTIRENLLLARSEASHEELVEVAKRAKIHSFIQSLPRGYDTYIGEGGCKLSGGERQRLAIARALLKNAPIMILDEPTTGLDPVTEREVLVDLQDILKGHTTLLITHRLVGLDQMDEILVLNQGRVVERGTHRELLHRDGYYRERWEMHASSKTFSQWSSLTGITERRG